MTLDIGWLDDLAALATHLNFSRAAEARNVTQPAFSRRIRALEEWVGCSLVERDTHKIRFTPGGELFLQASRDAMRQLQQGRLEAVQAQDNAPIRFASTHALSLTFFPRWFGEVSGVISSTPINLVADNMVACERLMLEGGAHFLLCHRHPDTRTLLDGQDFETIILSTDDLVLVSGCGEDGNPLHVVPGDPASPTPYLAFDERSGIGRIVATVASDLMKTLNATTIFTSQLALVLKNLAQQGRGVAWAPLSLVREELDPNGNLVLANPGISIPIEIVLIRGRASLNRAVGDFWSRVQERCDEDRDRLLFA
ncbi:LysR family transcriptional regulator [Flaviflagellibacter deserti]|uniref:LysR family transcriptional regulator n=1 Tax=Flaviflagellibacter deserti TaxID=2267266 RepID=A0ABV9YYG6_9HYPH